MEQHAHLHTAFLCDGSVWAGGGGSRIGHLLPGIILSVWGVHWLLSSLAAHFITAEAATARSSGATIDADADSTTLLSEQRPPPPPAAAAAAARSAASPAAIHPLLLPWLRQQPRGRVGYACATVEAWLKLLLPVLAIMLEFALSGTRSLVCPPGSAAKAGQLDVRHANSWSHASNYPPLIISGAIDLLHHARPLPRGLPHAALSLAFATSAFLMLAHTKAEPLDGALHSLLGGSMAAVAAAVAADGAWPGLLVLQLAKSLALLMEAGLFLAITHILFAPAGGSDSAWRASLPGDATRLHFVPVLAAWMLLGLQAFMLCAFLALRCWLAPSSSSSSAQRGRKQLLRSGKGRGAAAAAAKNVQLHGRAASRPLDDSSSAGDGGSTTGWHKV